MTINNANGHIYQKVVVCKVNSVVVALTESKKILVMN